MVTVIRTAVTVNASRKADKKAADITNNKDKSILDLMVCSNLVKITMSRFFIKKIADTMNTKSKITSRFVSISCKTCFGSVKPSSNAWKAIKPPGCRG